MSKAVLRRNSGKQGLQKLLRLTAQRSVEDAEEVERERRRRARQASRQSSEESAEDGMHDGGLKPCGSTSPEEDEGFGDWTQRQERRRQQRLQELHQGGDEDEDEDEVLIKAAPEQTPPASTSRTLQRQEQDETDRRTETERRKEGEDEEEIRTERTRRQKEREEEAMPMGSEVQKRKEVQISCTSKVSLHQEPNGDATKEEVTSYRSSNTKGSKSVETERIRQSLQPKEIQEVETKQRPERIRQSLQPKEIPEVETKQRPERIRQSLQPKEIQEVETKQRPERIRQSLQPKEIQEVEQPSRRQAEQEVEELRRRRQERRWDEEEQPWTAKEQITETTESLNRSLKKSNSLKKTKTPVLLPKIDDRMEQYALAVETSRDPVKAALSDLPGSPEAVASKKNLFEAGEAWSPTRGITCKDAEGLKVVVADRISRWAKGPADGSRPLPCRASDVKSGDVMHKKNMWEVIGDSSPSPGRQAKAAAGKKYRFVVTGHGKYEKVAVASEDGGVTDRKSDSYHGDH